MPTTRLKPSRSVHRWGLAFIIIYAVARAWWSWHVAGVDAEAILTPDTPEYLGSARALLTDGRFWTAPGSGVPDFRRTPGYPLLLAGLLAVRDDLQWLAGAQSVLAGALAPATYLVARRLVAPRAALLAAAIVALDPLLIVAGGTIMTEALSAVTLLAVVAAAWMEPKTDRLQRIVAWSFALGLALAVATHVRPTTYYFAPILLALVALQLRRQGARRALIAVLAAAMPIILLIGGWQVRNHQQIGTWRFTSIEAVNLYGFRAAGIVAEVEGVPFFEARRHLGLEGDTCPPWWQGSECPADDERGAFYDRMAAEGARIVLDQPVIALQQAVAGTFRILFGPGLRTVTDFLTFLPPTTGVRTVLALWSVPTSALALGSALLLMRHPDPDTRRRWWYVVALVAYVVAISAGPDGYSRFRTPLVPLLALLIAGGAQLVVERRRSPE